MRRGITLVELLVAIGLVSVLSIALVTRTNPVPSGRLAGAAEKLAADINNARRLAMAEHRVYSVDFSGNGYAVRFLDDETGEPVDVTCPHTGKGEYRVDFTEDGRLGGVEIASVDFGGSPGLRFGSFGKPYDASGAELSQEGSVTLTLGDSSMRVHVVPETGRAFRGR